MPDAASDSMIVPACETGENPGGLEGGRLTKLPVIPPVPIGIDTEDGLGMNVDCGVALPGKRVRWENPVAKNNIPRLPDPGDE